MRRSLALLLPIALVTASACSEPPTAAVRAGTPRFDGHTVIGGYRDGGTTTGGHRDGGLTTTGTHNMGGGVTGTTTASVTGTPADSTATERGGHTMTGGY